MIWAQLNFTLVVNENDFNPDWRRGYHLGIPGNETIVYDCYDLMINALQFYC
jgi:hypothetical protein